MNSAPSTAVVDRLERRGRASAAAAVGATRSAPALPPTLSVGMITYQTKDNTHEVADPLGAVVAALNAERQADILLAPEWFFGAPPKHLASRAEYERVKATLLQASRGRHTLIVPGTICWVDEQGHYRNTALVIANGETILEHSKRHDGEEAEGVKQAGFEWVAGTAPGMFRWRGLDVGIEICRDHGDGLLRQDLKHARQDGVDLQLIVSSGVWTQTKGLAVRERGLVLNNEGTFYGPTLWQRLPAEPAGKPVKSAGQADYRYFEEGGARREVALQGEVVLKVYDVPTPRVG